MTAVHDLRKSFVHIRDVNNVCLPRCFLFASTKPHEKFEFYPLLLVFKVSCFHF